MRLLWILGLAALAACGKTNSQAEDVSAPETAEAPFEAPVIEAPVKRSGSLQRRTLMRLRAGADDFAQGRLGSRCGGGDARRPRAGRAAILRLRRRRLHALL